MLDSRWRQQPDVQQLIIKWYLAQTHRRLFLLVSLSGSGRLWRLLTSLHCQGWTVSVSGVYRHTQAVTVHMRRQCQSRSTLYTLCTNFVELQAEAQCDSPVPVNHSLLNLLDGHLACLRHQEDGEQHSQDAYAGKEEEHLWRATGCKHNMEECPVSLAAADQGLLHQTLPQKQLPRQLATSTKLWVTPFGSRLNDRPAGVAANLV